MEEINFENVFPCNEHISFENFVIDVENGFRYSNECIGKQCDVVRKQKSFRRRKKESQTKHTIRSANRISTECSVMTKKE